MLEPIFYHHFVPIENKITFSESIKNMIIFLDKIPNSIVNIPQIIFDFHFEKRRFNDLLNVLEVLQICKKLNKNELIWYGISSFESNLSESSFYPLSKNKKNEKISIFTISSYLIKEIITKKTQIINIKKISDLYTNNIDRRKTIYCKMYQVSHILIHLGILSKTNNTSELKLNNNFYESLKNRKNKKILEISNLLNKPNFKNNEEYFSILV